MFEALAGRLDEALKLSERAVELEPLSGLAHLGRARILGWARRYEDAFAAHTKAARGVPDRSAK